MSDAIRDYNRRAWDKQVELDNEWTRPVTSQQIAEAKAGKWEVVLTPKKAVPRNWFPEEMAGLRILCLASAGGQQGPIFSAAGADVTVFDNSPKQLMQDQMVAERDGLAIELVEGDMRDLSKIADESIDLIFHPVSNCFIPNLEPLWSECFRVLRPKGSLLAGILKPEFFLFDYPKYEKGELEVKHKLPYSDIDSISEEERAALEADNEPYCFSHTLESQLGGQLQAGFLLSDLFEDVYPDESKDALSPYTPTFIATRAIKP